mmetsp:Transcript_16417/g.35496  ORF Transcript_16417/g.35496 Transcript_16417/m.35496 type:complete len:250 (+) Transcript_16417:281-1030(+)
MSAELNCTAIFMQADIETRFSGHCRSCMHNPTSPNKTNCHVQQIHTCLALTLKAQQQQQSVIPSGNQLSPGPKHDNISRSLSQNSTLLHPGNTTHSYDSASMVLGCFPSRPVELLVPLPLLLWSGVPFALPPLPMPFMQPACCCRAARFEPFKPPQGRPPLASIMPFCIPPLDHWPPPPFCHPLQFCCCCPPLPTPVKPANPCRELMSCWVIRDIAGFWPPRKLAALLAAAKLAAALYGHPAAAAAVKK